MPYDPDKPETLPEAVRKDLSPTKQRQWAHVFNGTMAHTGDEKAAFAAAWSVAEKSAGDGDDLAKGFATPSVQPRADVLRWVSMPDGRTVPVRIPGTPEAGRNASEGEQLDEQTGQLATGGADASTDIQLVWSAQATVPNQADWLLYAIAEAVANSREAVQVALDRGLISRGRIDIILPEGEHETPGQVFSVADNGIGMSMADIQRRFLRLGGSEDAPCRARDIILGAANSLRGGYWRLRTHQYEIASDTDLDPEVGIEEVARDDFFAGCRVEIVGPMFGTRFATRSKDWLWQLVGPLDADLSINAEAVVPVSLTSFALEADPGLEARLPRDNGMAAFFVPEDKIAEAFGFDSAAVTDCALCGWTVVTVNGIPAAWFPRERKGVLMLAVTTPFDADDEEYPLDEDRRLTGEFFAAWAQIENGLQAAPEPAETETAPEEVSGEPVEAEV